MTDTPLRVAVVGHTNTGKTSLLRTLTRDAAFGEVSDRPAVTRQVEGAALTVSGTALLDLFDTPGMEDSIGLLDHLDGLMATHHVDGLRAIERFLDSDEARSTFVQEAKALRQALASDILLYVIDTREPMLGKYGDELEILRRGARPVVPVLNFVASEEARIAEWREQLARLGLHAVAEFDTVVLDPSGERRLFEKMLTLLDHRRATINALIEGRAQQRDALIDASARLVADLLIDAAASVTLVRATEAEADPATLETFRDAVRRREQQCVESLLELHRFRTDDVEAATLPIDDGRWGVDLFSPEALRDYGVQAGGGAAAGAMAGLTIDAMVGGLSLGAATAIGAAVGAVLGAGRARGRQVVHRLRGLTELRCDDATLRRLGTRQVHLVRALLRRGHAAVHTEQLGADGATIAPLAPGQSLPPELRRAQARAPWSRLNEADRGISAELDVARQGAVNALGARLRPHLDGTAPADAT